jgi:Tfp pilus assembly protein PilN
MINLIPPVARKNLVREYWARVITVWMFLAGTASLIILLLLLPTYVLIGVQISALKQIVASSSEKSSSYDLSAAALLEANRQAQLLVGTPELTPFSAYSSQLESLASGGVVLKEERFSRKGDGGTIQISGVASTRQSLADFRDSIEADDNFTNVDLPISSLIKDRDLLFSMQITISTSTVTKTATSS